jgi:transposase
MAYSDGTTRLDARTQSREALQTRREQVIQLRQDGLPVMKIVRQTGLSWSAVNAAIHLFKDGGMAALKPAARGRKSGTSRILTQEQEAQIRMFIRFKRPRQYGLNDSLWSFETVMALVVKKFHIKLSARGLGGYLTRWGLRVNTKKMRPQENCSAVIRDWLPGNYADILQRATREDAAIYWLNNSVKLSTSMWCQMKPTKNPAPDLQAPSHDNQGRRIVSVTNNQGRVRWLIITGHFTVARQIRFVESLMMDCNRRKLFLIKNQASDFAAAGFTRFIATDMQSVKIFPIDGAYRDGPG